MNNNKNGLDEMQKQRRDSIGNQMFMLMFFALLLNSGLHGAGITWLTHPADVMVIISACMGIYLVRLIASNAYLPAKAPDKKGIVSHIAAIIFSTALAITAVDFFGVTIVETESATDYSAMIMFVVSGVGLLAALITTAVKKVSDKEDKED